MRVEKLRSNNLSVYVQGRDHQRRIITPQKMTWAQLSAKLQSWNAKGRYIVQQGISLKLHNGRVHDYRMLVQKNGEGEWKVTGCAGRVGASGSITSNLHGGGEAVKMDSLLLSWLDSEIKVQQVKEQADTLGVSVASFLEEKYGALCELALDLAIDREGDIWLLEVNPKPSREVFARIGDRDTYRAAISRPIEYANWYYHHILQDPNKRVDVRSFEYAQSARSNYSSDSFYHTELHELDNSLPASDYQLLNDEYSAAAKPRRVRRKGMDHAVPNKPYYPALHPKDTSSSRQSSGSRADYNTNELINLIQSYD